MQKNNSILKFIIYINDFSKVYHKSSQASYYLFKALGDYLRDFQQVPEFTFLSCLAIHSYDSFQAQADCLFFLPKFPSPEISVQLFASVDRSQWGPLKSYMKYLKRTPQGANFIKSSASQKCNKFPLKILLLPFSTPHLPIVI